MTVSLALGDTDAHAKDTSVFNDPGGTVRLTPMYDIAPTLAFIRQRQIALPVAGRFVMTEITREHVVREASSRGMPERLARHTVERTLSAMRGAVSAADAAHPGLRADVRAASLEQLERVSRS